MIKMGNPSLGGHILQARGFCGVMSKWFLMSSQPLWPWVRAWFTGQPLWCFCPLGDVLRSHRIRSVPLWSSLHGWFWWDGHNLQLATRTHLHFKDRWGWVYADGAQKKGRHQWKKPCYCQNQGTIILIQTLSMKPTWVMQKYCIHFVPYTYIDTHACA